MKYIAKSIAVLLLSSASISAFSAEKPINMQQGKSSDKGMMQMSEEMKDKMARDQQQYILQIDDLSDRIQDEKNADKKQALMDEQLQVIKDHQEKKRQMKKQMMQKHHQKMMNKKSKMKM